MKTRVLAFVEALRGTGLPVAVSESLDALRALSVLGIEREPFRDGMAAALVKDEADRPTFDTLFDRFFGLPERPGRSAKRPRANGGGDGHAAAHSATGSGRSQPPEPRHDHLRHYPRPERQRADAPKRSQHPGAQLARRRALHNTPFRALSASDIEACTALVVELAERFRTQLSRRQRIARRGAVDMRRTLRRSISTGGVPIDPVFRHRRPRRLDLVALCDCSHSVATASTFLLSLLAPAHLFFRNVRLFAFVDRPVEVSIESGRLVPHAALDLYAPSDLGRTLVQFRDRFASLLTRNTILLILGDARNNRRPPRADVLARMRAAVRNVVWLNPDAPQDWNTGDSVMRAYESHCDTLVAAGNLRQLHAALQRVFRRC